MSLNAEGGGGGGGSCEVSANEYRCTYTGAQINIGDQTPYLTYVVSEFVPMVGQHGKRNTKKALEATLRRQVDANSDRIRNNGFIKLILTK
jgi:hypothetical protein